MKKQITIMAITLLLLAGPAFAETIHVGVDGLVCAFCAKGIEKSFKAQPETQKVDVNLDDGLVTVVTKKDTTMKDVTIKKLISDAGFKVTSIHHMNM
jgi:copper chaperone CopZ